MKNKELKKRMLEQIKDWNKDDENTVVINWNDIGWFYEIIKNWTGIPYDWYIICTDGDNSKLSFDFYVKKYFDFYLSIDLKTKKACTFSRDFELIGGLDFTNRKTQTMIYKQIKRFLYGEQNKK